MSRLLQAGPPDTKRGKGHAAELAELGHAIAERREELHWSQDQLAREAGVNAETVRQIERGITEPKTATLEKISAVLEAKA